MAQTVKKVDPFRVGVVAALALIVVVVLALWGIPKYGIYSKQLRGQADLEEARFNRQILVEEAEAEATAEELRKTARITQAEGIAEANRIIGEQLAGVAGERYLRFLYLQGLVEGEDKIVVYVPTEAGVPITEANRLLPEVLNSERR